MKGWFPVHYVFRIRYESYTVSGSVNVRATSRGQALQRFKDWWTELRDEEVPTHWVEGCVEVDE